MDLKCSFEQDFNLIASEIMRFERPENDIVFRKLSEQKDLILFGCYMPGMPAVSGGVSGRLQLRRLSEHLTELHVMDMEYWAENGVMALIDHLSGGK
jgi:hypothetical protein